MKHFLSLTTCLSAFLLLTSPADAAKKKSASPAPSAAPSASPSGSPATRTFKGIPFHGMISAVDGRAKTFTISSRSGARVFKISNETSITRQGAIATMKDVVEKEEVRGLYRKEADGTLQAVVVKVGPLTEEEKAAEAARKARRAERRAAKAAASPSASPATSPSASPSTN